MLDRWVAGYAVALPRCGTEWSSGRQAQRVSGEDGGA